MIATCPACAWPSPAPLSSHGRVQYARCVCGQWLISESGRVIATAGASVFADEPAMPDTARTR